MQVEHYLPEPEEVPLPTRYHWFDAYELGFIPTEENGLLEHHSGVRLENGNIGPDFEHATSEDLLSDFTGEQLVAYAMLYRVANFCESSSGNGTKYKVPIYGHLPVLPATIDGLPVLPSVRTSLYALLSEADANAGDILKMVIVYEPQHNGDLPETFRYLEHGPAISHFCRFPIFKPLSLWVNCDSPKTGVWDKWRKFCICWPPGSHDFFQTLVPGQFHDEDNYNLTDDIEAFIQLHTSLLED